jgi:hypothetical protein
VYQKANLFEKWRASKFIPVRTSEFEKRDFGQVSESGKLPPGKFIRKECAHEILAAHVLAPSAIRRWKDSFVIDHIYDGEAL